jgi:hypothetical protein
MLSSVVPYAADLTALRFVPPRFFGVFMSIHPVPAALVGTVWAHVRSEGFAGSEGFAEQMRAIEAAVVGQHPAHGDPVVGEPGSGAEPEGRGGLLPLVGEDLGVGQSRVAIDGGVQGSVADPGSDRHS